MEGLIVKAEDQLKLEVVCKVESGKMTRSEAMTVLQVSKSTLKRYVMSYREKGVGFLRHGNCQRKPTNKTPDEIKDIALRLIQEKYFDFNMTHAREKIEEETGYRFSREKFRKWCHGLGTVKRPKKRRVKPRYYRNRLPQPGLLVQMDGSTHRWFGGVETTLVAAVDDATGEVLYAEFFDGETTLACLKVLREIVKKYGAFQILYTDKAGVYGGIKRSNFSQVERALAEVGTHVLYAHSPEAKGRIERLFGTLQDRLIAEMRLNKIITMKQANHFLQNTYLPYQHNPRFTVLAQNPVSAFRALPPACDPSEIFCIKEYRQVAKDHTISIGGEKWRIADQLEYSISKQRIELRWCEEIGGWKPYHAGKQLTLIKVLKVKSAGASDAA
jgi:transposase